MWVPVDLIAEEYRVRRRCGLRRFGPGEQRARLGRTPAGAKGTVTSAKKSTRATATTAKRAATPTGRTARSAKNPPPW